MPHGVLEFDGEQTAVTLRIAPDPWFQFFERRMAEFAGAGRRAGKKIP